MDEDFAQRQLALQPLFTRTARLLGQAAGLLLLANAGSDRDRQRSHLRVAHAQWQELAAAFGDLDSPRDASPSHRAIGATIQRLGEMLERLGLQRQFLVITHNHVTMSHASSLYGIHLDESGSSHLVSVRLEDIRKPNVRSASAAQAG